ncbi:MAG: putative bifunctional diguanylate cyclase/phosphodiesterase [Vulcanimicrobiaceae bacterium]
MTLVLEAMSLLIGVVLALWIVGRFVQASRQRTGEERRYSILESIPDGLFIVDAHWRFTHVNEKAEELLRSNASDLIGRSIERVLDPLASELLPEMKAARESGRAIERTQYFRVNDSWIEIRLQPASGETLVYLRDITARMRVETLLRDSERRLRLLLNQVPALLWAVDMDMNFTSIVGAGLSTQGINERDLMGKNFELMLADIESRERAVAVIRRAFGGDAERFETRHSERWLQHHVEPLRGINGSIVGAIGVALDITEMKETADHFAHLARVDALTQLPNRLALEERLGDALDRARSDHHALGVLFVDVDRFKNINDTLGHRAGDDLLRAFAARLRSSLDPRASVFRSGGDEFIIVMPLGDTLSIAMVAADIQAALGSGFHVAGRELYVTASIGTSRFPHDGTSAEELVMHADSAMYRAKQTGRNRIKSYDATTDSVALVKLRLEQDLHHAIERNELRLVFQPIVRVSDAQIVGAEALLRWMHDKHGEILPEEFIGIAEVTGLIVGISHWVIRGACAQAAEIRASCHPDFRIAVNLSARDFAEPDLADFIVNVLRESGLPPDALDIEITESVMIDDLALQTLGRLRSIGVRIVIDDFGIAYSSLGYLKRLPVGAVKIDRAFIRDITHDSYDQAIVRAIVTLAKTLGFGLIAEGVESPEQLAFVANLDCDQAQGFHFSVPLAAQELRRVLREGVCTA